MGTFTATGSGNWTASTSWSNGSAPGAADDVIIPSGATVTIQPSTTPVCRSLTVESGGTLAWAAYNTLINIGSSTPGPGNVAVSISTGATITTPSATGTGNMNFVSTSSTQQTITTGGKDLPNININGAGSSYLLTDALKLKNINGSEAFKVTTGTFDTGSNNMDIGLLDSTGTATRTITLGSSAITIRRNGTAIQLASTGLTMTANTATFTTTASPTINCGGVDMNGSSLVLNGAGPMSFATSATWAKITRTASAAKTDTLNITSGTTVTTTGTLTLDGNSAVNRLFVQSTTPGSPGTLNAATVSASYVDFMDITAAGAASWNLSAITGGSGDCGGNSGITFTTPTTRYLATAGLWSSTGTWSATATNGSTGASLPLPQDTVIGDGSSPAGTYTCDLPRPCTNLNLTGFTRQITLSTGLGQTFYGSLTLSSGMTLAFGNTVDIKFAGRGSHTITSAGKTFAFTNGSISLTNSVGGTYTLLDALTITASSASQGQLTVNDGTLDTGGFTVTAPSLVLGATSRTRAFTAGSSTIATTLTNAANFVSVASTSGLSLSAASATVALATSSISTRTFAGGGTTWGTLQYTVANSNGALAISGNNTFTTLDVGPNKTLQITNGSTQTVTNFTPRGQVNGYQQLPPNPTNTPQCTVLDSTALSITGDIAWIFRFAADAWATTNMPLLSKRNDTTNQRSWSMSMNSTSKQLSLTLSTNGTAFATSVSSSVAVPFADGAAGWIAVTWRASDGRVQFFTGSDSTNDPSAVTFTQLGVDRTISIASIFDSTAPVEIGTSNQGALASAGGGKWYRVRIKNSISSLTDDTGLALDADFTTKQWGADSFTESSGNGATVSLLTTAAQVGDGRLRIESSSAGSAGTITKLGGAIEGTYLQVKDSTVGGTSGPGYAGPMSLDASGNTNWRFEDRFLPPKTGRPFRHEENVIRKHGGRRRPFNQPIGNVTILAQSVGASTSVQSASFVAPTTVQPNSVACSFAVQAPDSSASSSASASVVATSVQVGSVVGIIDSATQPVAVSTSVAVNAPVISAPLVVAADSTSAVITVASPVISLSKSVSTTDVATTTLAVETAIVTGSAEVPVDAVAAAASIEIAVVTAEGNTTAVPASVAMVGVVENASLVISSLVSNVSAVAAQTVLPVVAVLDSEAVQVAPVAATTTIATPYVYAIFSLTVTPQAVAATTLVQQPTVHTSSVVPVDTVALATASSSPDVALSVEVATDVVGLAAALLQVASFQFDATVSTARVIATTAAPHFLFGPHANLIAPFALTLANNGQHTATLASSGKTYGIAVTQNT